MEPTRKGKEADPISAPQRLLSEIQARRKIEINLSRSRKVDFYLSACLDLAQQALRGGDRVSFFAFSSRLHLSIVQARRLDSLLPLFKGDPRLRPREESTDY